MEENLWRSPFPPPRYWNRTSRWHNPKLDLANFLSSASVEGLCLSEKVKWKCCINPLIRKEHVWIILPAQSASCYVGVSVRVCVCVCVCMRCVNRRQWLSGMSVSSVWCLCLCRYVPARYVLLCLLVCWFIWKRTCWVFTCCPDSHWCSRSRAVQTSVIFSLYFCFRGNYSGVWD